MFKIVLRISIFIIITIFMSGQLFCKSQSDIEIADIYNKLSKSKILDSVRVSYLLSLTYHYIFLNPAEGIRIGNLALNIAKKNNNFIQIADCYNTLGLNYWQNTDYANSLTNYLKAEEFFIKANFDKGLAKVYNNLSALYLSVEQYDKAENYVNKSLNYNIKSNNTKKLFSNYINLGDIATAEFKYSNALQYYFKSLQNNNLYSNGIHTENIYLGIAKVYCCLNDYSKALYYLLSVDTLNLKSKKESTKSRLILQKVELQIKNDIDTNQHKQVLEIFGKNKKNSLLTCINLINQQSLYFERITDNLQLLKCYELLGLAYLELGDKNHAIHNFEQFKLFSDSLKRTNQVRKLTMAEVDNKISFQNKELEMKERELASNRDFFIAIIIILIVLLIAFINAIKLLRINRFQKAELINKNSTIMDTNIELEKLLEVVSEKQQQIEKTNIELNEANATKDKFFSILSHDLKSPFTGIMGLSELLSTEANNMEINEITVIGASINKSANHTFELLNQLLDWSRSQLGVINFEPSPINLNTLIDKIINSSQSAASVKNITISTNHCNDSKITGDENMLSTVIRNILNNSIKFTNTNGNISVNTYREDNFIKFSIQDDGVGINNKVLENLFKLGCVNSTYGTNNEKGTGLGLILCKEFVDKHSGKIWAESELGKGSIFHILLPIETSSI